MPDWQSIPGETPIDPSGLKIAGITNRAELSSVEGANIRKALSKYLTSKPSRREAPFDLDWCQRLHKEMFGDVWDWAGQIRTRNLNLGIPFGTIRDTLAALLGDLAEWPTYKMHWIEQAARLHYRAVLIHPFENGNGRWSRLLSNIWLRRNGQGVIVWPEATIGAESVIRSDYIAAIKKADAGDLEPLVELHRHYEQRQE
jgi:Fic-DOC domain mobile mystery protein B